MTLGGLVSLLLVASASAQVRGRVVVTGQESRDVLVTLVTQTGQIVDQTFTRIAGDFLLNGVNVATFRSDNPVYLVVEEPGYQPFRYQIFQSELRNGGLPFTIYLEPETENVPAEVAREAEDPSPIDIRQLQAEIPPAAADSYEAALGSLEDGEADRAAEQLEFAVTLAPAFYDAWVALAQLYERQERVGDALSAYERAAGANPNGVLAQINLGALHYQQGEQRRAEQDLAAFDEYAQAREWLVRSVRFDPSSPVARFYLGATLYRLGSYEDSAAWLLGAVALDGGYASAARSMLINVYARQERYPEALEQAELFLRENPDAPEREAIERARAQLEAAMNP